MDIKFFFTEDDIVRLLFNYINNILSRIMLYEIENKLIEKILLV